MYGMVCEIILCMFKHEEVPEENVRDEIVIHDDSAGDEIVNQDESLMDLIVNGFQIIDVEENEEFIEKENETIEHLATHLRLTNLQVVKILNVKCATLHLQEKVI